MGSIDPEYEEDVPFHTPITIGDSYLSLTYVDPPNPSSKVPAVRYSLGSTIGLKEGQVHHAVVLRPANTEVDYKLRDINGDLVGSSLNCRFWGVTATHTNTRHYASVLTWGPFTTRWDPMVLPNPRIMEPIAVYLPRDGEPNKVGKWGRPPAMPWREHPQDVWPVLPLGPPADEEGMLWSRLAHLHHGDRPPGRLETAPDPRSVTPPERYSLRDRVFVLVLEYLLRLKDAFPDSRRVYAFSSASASASVPSSSGSSSAPVRRPVPVDANVLIQELMDTLQRRPGYLPITAVRFDMTYPSRRPAPLPAIAKWVRRRAIIVGIWPRNRQLDCILSY